MTADATSSDIAATSLGEIRLTTDTTINAMNLSPRPIIAAVSGFSDLEHAARCREVGIAYVFIKPSDISDIKNFIYPIAHTCE